MSRGKQFNEILVFCDDRKKIWQAIGQGLQKAAKPYIKLPSSTPVRRSWRRFAQAPLILIHWECQQRKGGTLVEELLEIDPAFDTTNRILVITSEPSREDVIYFSELGLKKIVRLIANNMQISKSIQEIAREVAHPRPVTAKYQEWLRLQRTADQLEMPADEQQIRRLQAQLEQVADDTTRGTARYFDIMGAIAYKSQRFDQAEKLWDHAVELNPHYARSYRGLIEVYCERRDYRRALDLIQNLQRQNKKNVSRLVKMGEIYSKMADDLKAEHYFQLALERDQHCGGALNGLASLRFRQGKLDESRNLLEQSTTAYKLAATLNQEGIALVKQGRYEEALTHYSRAQYVLPQQEKGAMLLYNIGLCYSRWGKNRMAENFLELALAKDPGYTKAQRLMHQIQKMPLPAQVQHNR
jgi:tetratricopeptide (TPR) repeat protein